MVGGKLAFDAILIDKHSIEHPIRFYNLAMVWILRCAFSDTVAPEKMKSIDWGSLLRGNSQDFPVMNLTVEPPRLFAIIPEWILDDICEFYLYVLRYCLFFFLKLTVISNKKTEFVRCILSKSLAMKSRRLP